MWPLILTLVGVVLLLDNFLLLGDFNVFTLWPLLLVMAGGVLLLRGDFIPDDSARTFGITRGNIESAILEIRAGDIDVHLWALDRPERLIAGKYAANAQPNLNVDDVHAHLQFNRAATSPLIFADWELALAQDIPWHILTTSHIGQIQADLSKLITEGGVIATGMGDIHLTTPEETLTPLKVQTNLGRITVKTPIGYKTRIRVSGARTFTRRVDERRYTQIEPDLYIARDAHPESPLVDVNVVGVLGDVYLV